MNISSKLSVIDGVRRSLVAPDAPEELPRTSALADALLRRDRRHAPQELLLLGRGESRQRWLQVHGETS